MTVRSYGLDTDFVHLTLEIWPRVEFIDMTLGQGHDTPLGHGQQWCEISRSNMAVRNYVPETDFGYMCTMTLTLGQGHDTPLGHGQQWCEISFRSNMAVRSYGPDTKFRNMCTITLSLEIWPWAKAMTHPWNMDNNSRSNMAVRSYGLDINFGCVHYDLDDMTLGQGHDTSLGHGQ